MREYLLVPKEDIEALKKAYKELQKFLDYNNSYGNPVTHITQPIRHVIQRKYSVAVDLQEPDQ